MLRYPRVRSTLQMIKQDHKVAGTLPVEEDDDVVGDLAMKVLID